MRHLCRGDRRPAATKLPQPPRFHLKTQCTSTARAGKVSRKNRHRKCSAIRSTCIVSHKALHNRPGQHSTLLSERTVSMTLGPQVKTESCYAVG